MKSSPVLRRTINAIPGKPLAELSCKRHEAQSLIDDFKRFQINIDIEILFHKIDASLQTLAFSLT